ncbi:MAG: Para-aminobenzoate synthase, aminase component [uncultured Solirubrobacteraceae bacterium]|uniref:Para-aminobenzoate synthase, aminase component n=1 Tax=uncultured Solirubrobacteraceae bacterium TaxID=1162706 RepID=A0A6J4RNY0_9ACTN|nr:MAG: Para-aminobenzoate synthase, aminase component [uncultured Solirubrobacteraceae bacterium]
MTSVLGHPVARSLPERVELVRVALDFVGDALAVLAALADLPHPFALTGRWAGGGAVLGADPRRVLGADEDPFGALDELPPLERPEPGGVGGGWFGYLGYRLGSRVERLPPPPPRPAAIPDFHLAYYDTVVRQDAAGAWWLEALRDAGGDPDLDARLAALERRLAAAARDGGRASDSTPGPFRVAAPGHAGHRRAVAEAVERIAAGDLFQVNLGLRLEAAGAFDALALYTRAARALQPAYGAVFATEWGGVVSLSPELFLRRRGREVVTGPIKGTVPRPADAGGEREALLGSPKDAAEHVMIVDLMRNDLGRVCEYGSVSRHENRRIEPHPGVWHLVSDVEGTLRPGVGDGELVRATFPPGSVTGAPKVQAMRLISELEGTGRELYTGALGFASPVAGLELSVGIRTFELGEDSIWLGAGGGIVADSDPAAELAEALAKAAPLVRAIGAEIVAEAGPLQRTEPARRCPRASALVAAPRPNPATGVMETARVRAGEPVALADHLERLRASVERLYGQPLPADLEERARAAAALSQDARLRIHAAPSPAGMRFSCETAPLPRASGEPVELFPVVLPGGLGAHKWRDRRLLDALSERVAPAVPLLLDSDGSVLEAAWGNVWIRDGAEHRTPPADGRLLPGIARSRRLAELRAAGATVAEAPLTLTDLARGAAYLTSSLREPTPACLPEAVRRSIES